MSWSEGLRLAIRLAKAGILVLVDRGAPSSDVHLGGLVRALLDEHDEVSVCVDASDLERLGHGSVVVYAPRSRDAVSLNLGRPMIAERALRIILWCESDIAAQLALGAPDFFDWISHRFETPRAASPVPQYVVATLRRADEEGVAVAWPSNVRPEPFVERTSSQTPKLHRIRGSRFTSLVDALRDAPAEAWIYVYGFGKDTRHRARWAMAETGRRRRVLLVGANPGLWPLRVQPLTLLEAHNRLREAGAGVHAGRIAALVDLERGAVVLAVALLKRGATVEQVVEIVSGSVDPGAALAQELLRIGALDLDYVALGCPQGDPSWSEAAMPLLRGLSDHPGVRVRRDRLWLETAHALERGEQLDEDQLGWWAASAPGLETVPLPLHEQERRTLLYAIEASLWDARSYVHPGARAQLAAGLGEQEAAQHWASQDVGSVSDVLAAWRKADRARHAGLFAESLLGYDDALRLGQSERMPLPRIAEIHARRAVVLYELGRYGEVVAELERVVRDVRTPVAMATLGHALVTLWRDLEYAHELLRDALELERRNGEHNADPYVVACCAEEAIARGHYARAHELLRELQQRGAGHHWPNALAVDLLRREGRVIEARDQYQRTLASNVGRTNASAALGLTTLAAILIDSGDFVGARARLDEARTATVAAFGERHPLLATIALWSGRCWARLGEPSSARAAFVGALSMTTFFFGEDHPRVYELTLELALTRYVEGDPNAIVELRAAFSRLEELLGGVHPEVVRMRHVLSGPLSFAEAPLAGSATSRDSELPAPERVLAALRENEAIGFGRIQMTSGELARQSGVLREELHEVLLLLRDRGRLFKLSFPDGYIGRHDNVVFDAALR